MRRSLGDDGAPGEPRGPAADPRETCRREPAALAAPAMPNSLAAVRQLQDERVCEVSILEAAAPLVGQDKWLGGELGDDGAIYGIPGSAKTVLKIVPETGQVTTIGDLRGPHVRSSLPGNRFKWLRGIRAGDGAIYGIPSNAEAVLKIVPSTQEVTTIGGPFKGQWKWHGGVLAGDGRIYGIPCNAEAVLRITPSTGAVELIGGPLVGHQKWYGGLLGDDGAVYGVPYNADTVLKIVPSTGEVTTIGSVPAGGWKWHGGVAAGGVIIGIPSHAESVLKIVPRTGEVRTIGGPIKAGRCRPRGKYKYGGAVVGGDGNVYALPSDADYVLKVVPSTDEVVAIGGCYDQTHNKWQNGFLASDGAIYAIPCDADAVLRIVPATGEVATVGGPFEGKDKWEGGVLAGDGAIYCMPQQAPTVLRVAPPPCCPGSAGTASGGDQRGSDERAGLAAGGCSRHAPTAARWSCLPSGAPCAPLKNVTRGLAVLAERLCRRHTGTDRQRLTLA
uniref:DUF6923 domain-containing protein n=1 Tax=Alexandrium monilatum TaxID=311494 RepID=A0A7S4Q9U4_9DINO|mmetsp:Transcript_53031/g.166602  ORF Transcript_53031/g.166602 Transcript_53031/m.166602 type:complete len:502 (-) Transcript_53031:8-1513(-)